MKTKLKGGIETIIAIIIITGIVIALIISTILPNAEQIKGVGQEAGGKINSLADKIAGRNQ